MNINVCHMLFGDSQGLKSCKIKVALATGKLYIQVILPRALGASTFKDIYFLFF